MDYEKKYKETLKKIENLRGYSLECNNMIDELFPELKMSEDERIRKNIKIALMSMEDNLSVFYSTHHTSQKELLAWLEKQGEEKEINLVDILKHYPRETELYSPLYGKLWLAEVDEEHEIITCYKHQLDEGCVRAILEQEDTVSFYSNGTTGLPDFTISKDCMLFLYDIEKQGEKQNYNPYKATIESIAAMVEKYANGDLKDFYDNIKVKCKDAMEYDNTWIEKQSEQNPTWSEEDELRFKQAIYVCRQNGYTDVENWLKSLKNRVQPQWRPTEEQMRALSMAYKDSLTSGENLITQTETLKSLYNDLKKL